MNIDIRRTPSASRAPLAAVSALALALALSACGREEQQAPTTTPAPAEAPQTTPAPGAGTGAADPAASNSATPGAAGDAGTTPQAQGSMGGVGDATRDAAGSAATALDDTGITTKVKAELVKDADLSALDVSVETNGGQVTLTGHAPTAQAKERAEGLAKGVDGVKGVTNNLEVKAGG
ncbi:MAG: Osmotically-inducible protein Y [Paracidovorax wautersii]|uniref:Osmotically-inducible protein Y n=1 Tax=Paracidovorax wautersii TaxID=1177982 RepID=A0A7V8JPM6_9BURK|nr:MAG: Osmotically-inducible protein Y [Paracidovorax wautersii]